MLCFNTCIKMPKLLTTKKKLRGVIPPTFSQQWRSFSTVLMRFCSRITQIHWRLHRNSTIFSSKRLTKSVKTLLRQPIQRLSVKRRCLQMFRICASSALQHVMISVRRSKSRSWSVAASIRSLPKFWSMRRFTATRLRDYSQQNVIHGGFSKQAEACCG